jgi:two-component system chemotaxis response regulator CheB
MALRGPNRRRFRACVIGTSTGGVKAVSRLLAALSPQFKPSVLVVQHVGADSGGLAATLGRSAHVPVIEAAERVRIEPRHVYVAPPGYHLLVEKNERFSLSVDEKVRWSRPSIDVLFESAADVWGATVVGVVLTGANDDGARGLKAVRDHGGRGIVQLPADAESPVMPQAALDLAGADAVLPLAEIAAYLHQLAGIK